MLEEQEDILLSFVTPERLFQILNRVLAEHEFLSPYGIRGISKVYEGDNKYVLQVENQRLEEEYIPAESVNNDFGGNSNWRGPVWFPINFMLIETLMHYYDFFGDEFKVHYLEHIPYYESNDASNST